MEFAVSKYKYDCQSVRWKLKIRVGAFSYPKSLLKFYEVDRGHTHKVTETPIQFSLLPIPGVGTDRAQDVSKTIHIP